MVRDDGRAFSEGADEPLSALGLDLRLGQPPPSDRLWSTAGMQAYRRGARPEAQEVFGRMTAVVDRFIDFDRSLAPQQTMAEFAAAYALSTWLLEAFGVVGFLWPSGDRGSGKTNLLHVVTQLSYLGTVLAASGSFAGLRDLADYGATLARLRIGRGPRVDGHNARQWRVTRGDLERWAVSYKMRGEET